MRVIGRWTDGDGFGRSAVEVAEMMGYFFERVCVELLALVDLV